jgi:MoaA/NifB/PqqE/SkfB family radical SAM enzyme
MTNMNSKKVLEENIPIIFKPKGMSKVIFPKDYVNDAKWWGNITKKELHSCFTDGTAKLLTMDLDIGDECSLRCPHCFRRDSRFDESSNPLSYDEIVGYMKQAKKLGLSQIKILGRGEPFQNKQFLGFLREMTKLNIGVGVFTKGHILGSDELTKIYNYDNYKIDTSEKLIKELKKLKVSIYLGFNSFDRKIQESFVGIDKSPIKNYVELRDKALIALVKAGFNEYKKGEVTRLAMICAPIKPENMDEVFEIFKWARERNIYMLSCPTTISGKGIDEFHREVETYRVSKLKKEHPQLKYTKALEKLYTKIYKWSVESGLISKSEIKKNGVSLYPGCHVCNQTSAGFYLNLSGQINQCPGRCDKSTIFVEDIRKEKSLKDAWKKSANYQRAKNTKLFNYHCVARDGRSIPVNFYNNIQDKVLK